MPWTSCSRDALPPWCDVVPRQGYDSEATFVGMVLTAHAFITGLRLKEGGLRIQPQRCQASEDGQSCQTSFSTAASTICILASR